MRGGRLAAKYDRRGIGIRVGGVLSLRCFNKRGQNARTEHALVPASADLVAVVLDDRVGEQVLAHLLDDRAGFHRVTLLEIDLDVFALADIADAGDVFSFIFLAFSNSSLSPSIFSLNSCVTVFD